MAFPAFQDVLMEQSKLLVVTVPCIPSGRAVCLVHLAKQSLPVFFSSEIMLVESSSLVKPLCFLGEVEHCDCCTTFIVNRISSRTFAPASFSCQKSLQHCHFAQNSYLLQLAISEGVIFSKRMARGGEG